MNGDIISTDCVVIGAGVIGLACAAAISKKGFSTIVLEEETLPFQHASSHNSEVIHAGIYYKKNSLKHRFCVEGNALLYEYCEKRGISFKKIGKLIVTQDKQQTEILEKLYKHGLDNDVNGLSLITEKQLLAIEPFVLAKSAIYSKTSGIFDSHAFSLSLEEEISSSGSHIITQSPVLGGTRQNEHWILEVAGASSCLIKSDIVVNASGLNAAAVASKLGIKNIPKSYYIRGHYYKYLDKNPFNHLIYPLPEKNGLGVHSTMDLKNYIRFGPDAEFIDSPSYEFLDTNARREIFIASINSFFNGFKPGSIAPDFCGVRVRLGKNHLESDFSILTMEEHGLGGLFNISGIDSPGLTSSLAIANFISSSL